MCGQGLVVKVWAAGNGGARVGGTGCGEMLAIVRAPFVCSRMAVGCIGSG